MNLIFNINSDIRSDDKLNGITRHTVFACAVILLRFDARARTRMQYLHSEHKENHSSCLNIRNSVLIGILDGVCVCLCVCRCR